MQNFWFLWQESVDLVCSQPFLQMWSAKSGSDMVFFPSIHCMPFLCVACLNTQLMAIGKRTGESKHPWRIPVVSVTVPILSPYATLQVHGGCRSDCCGWNAIGLQNVLQWLSVDAVECLGEVNETDSERGLELVAFLCHVLQHKYLLCKGMLWLISCLLFTWLIVDHFLHADVRNVRTWTKI